VPRDLESASFAHVRTAFLDRDGVINEKAPEGEYVGSWAAFHILPGVPEAIARLNRAGILAIVVSNQRGIAKGLYTAHEVFAMHAEFERLLAGCEARIDGFFFCPHDVNSCRCRKPLPGLFEQAAAAFPSIGAESSVMIGDSMVDVEFARGLAMPAIFIEGPPGRQKADVAAAAEMADRRVASLAEAVDLLLAGRV